MLQLSYLLLCCFASERYVTRIWVDRLTLCSVGIHSLFVKRGVAKDVFRQSSRNATTRARLLLKEGVGFHVPIRFELPTGVGYNENNQQYSPKQ